MVLASYIARNNVTLKQMVKFEEKNQDLKSPNAVLHSLLLFRPLTSPKGGEDKHPDRQTDIATNRKN